MKGVLELSVYDCVDRFSLHVAGFLLCDLEPLKPVRKLSDNDPYESERQEARVITEQLVFDAKAGKLKVENINGDDALVERNRRPEGRFGRDSFRNYGTEWYVKRNELANWAEKKGKKPAFLFPETASSLANNQKSVKPIKANNVIRASTDRSWFDLNQAAGWLAEKTKELWTPKRIIEFSIDQCRPDDIVEDKQYPTYLRAIQPVQQTIYVTDSHYSKLGKEYRELLEECHEIHDDEITGTKKQITKAIKGSVYVNAESKETSKLYKNNLYELLETGKTKVDYVFLSTKEAEVYRETASEKKRREESIFSAFQPVTDFLKQIGFCSLQEAFPYIVYAGIPYTLVVDIDAVGIRKKELKKLLRQYLELVDADTSSQQKQVLLSLENKQDKPKTENAGIGESDYLKIKKRIHPIDELIERAITEAGSDSINLVFLKLKAFANEEIPPEPLTGGCGARHIEHEKNNGEKADLTKQALGKKLGRRRHALEINRTKNGHLMDV